MFSAVFNRAPNGPGAILAIEEMFMLKKKAAASLTSLDECAMSDLRFVCDLSGTKSLEVREDFFCDPDDPNPSLAFSTPGRQAELYRLIDPLPVN